MDLAVTPSLLPGNEPAASQQPPSVASLVLARGGRGGVEQGCQASVRADGSTLYPPPGWAGLEGFREMSIVLWTVYVTERKVDSGWKLRTRERG